jgi:DegV family protein with EDD domain
MQMSFAIVTDSASNLPESLIDSFGLEVFALKFTVDDKEYRSYLKGKITDIKQFYTMMREGKVITTALPGLDEVDGIAREILDAGNDILYLGFDSALSGTFENTSSYLLRLQKDNYPERKVMCVDTRAAALGQGLLVTEAVKLRDKGATLEELTQWASDNRLRFAHWFTVDNLSYLQRGGRLSKGAAIAGTLLNIKPVLHVDDEGRLVPVDKVRGRKKSLQALYEQFMNTAAEPKSEQTVYISQADCIEDAQYLAELIREGAGSSDILINELDPVIGAHSGPGTVALFFQTDGDR